MRLKSWKRLRCTKGERSIGNCSAHLNEFSGLWTIPSSTFLAMRGRLILKRRSYEIDMDRILERVRKNGCFFEIKFQPEHVRRAAEAGVIIAVSTDADSTGEFGLMRCGIDQTRRSDSQ